MVRSYTDGIQNTTKHEFVDHLKWSRKISTETRGSGITGEHGKVILQMHEKWVPQFMG